MPPAEIAFWVAVLFVVYPYLIYPLYLGVIGKLCAQKVSREKGNRPGVSFVLCAYNEAKRIDDRVCELIKILVTTGIPGEIIVVSDGSSDSTADIVRRYTQHSVRLLELPHRGGKAIALSRGVELAKNPVLVFGDIRQTWAPDALELMLENFADPNIGAVSGDLVVVASKGAMEGVGLYWKLEKWMRKQESACGSQVGVTGAICAVRKELFKPIPAGTMLDDVYWPLCVVMQGKRVIHDQRALAYDRLPEDPRDEVKRKVRTLAGNFQLLTRLPEALLPWRNPAWFAYLSHKLARLVVPWMLIALFGLSWLAEGHIYSLALIVQLAFYGLALAGLMTKRGGKLTSAPASFALLNAAAWAAFWVWITGRAERSWAKVSYDSSQLSVVSSQSRTDNPTEN